MPGIFSFPFIETVILVLPYFFLFKSKAEFSHSLYSFLSIGTHTSGKKHESRCVKFAVYFSIIVLATLGNLLMRV
jgi:hypothetical protein